MSNTLVISNPYENSQSLPFRFRQKRFHHVKKLIDDILDRKGSCKIIDIGGEQSYWNIADDFIARQNIEVHMFNVADVQTTRPNFKSYLGDAAELNTLEDNAYDLVHSNSVIEHVGGWEQMARMAVNVRRLAPKYFVQTPNFWFPYEPHFRCPAFHWLPEQVRYRMLLNFRMGFAPQRQQNVDEAMRRIHSTSLLDRRQMRALFPDADIVAERFGFLTKSLMAIRD